MINYDDNIERTIMRWIIYSNHCVSNGTPLQKLKVN